MRDDDPVIAVLAAEHPHVLPWWVMKNHHVANLEVEGRPLLVTLCEACGGSSVFDRRVGGAELSFQVIGSYRGTHCIADYETQSIWASFLGGCLFGIHHGARLERLPLVQSSWGVWRALYPDSVVARGDGEPRDGHGEGHYPGSLERPLGKVQVDERLPFNELVLGVEVGEAAMTYRLAALAETDGALNDEVGGHPIVVFSRSDTWIAIAYAREVDGVTLELERRGGAVVDRETGSTWDLRGRAVSGPLEGSALRYVESGIEEWYVWAAYHPGVEVHDVARARVTAG
jgi:hypothetical protein